MQADKGDPRSYEVIGAAMEVHSVLGAGFLEAVNHEALAREFEHRAVPFRREAAIPIQYKGRPLNCTYRADFLCFFTLLVEIKALARLLGVEDAQLLNYLKASGLPNGLPINFGAPRLDYKRLIFTPTHLRPSASSVEP